MSVPTWTLVIFSRGNERVEIARERGLFNCSRATEFEGSNCEAGAWGVGREGMGARVLRGMYRGEKFEGEGFEDSGSFSAWGIL